MLEFDSNSRRDFAQIPELAQEGSSRLRLIAGCDWWLRRIRTCSSSCWRTGVLVPGSRQADIGWQDGTRAVSNWSRPPPFASQHQVMHACGHDFPYDRCLGLSPPKEQPGNALPASANAEEMKLQWRICMKGRCFGDWLQTGRRLFVGFEKWSDCDQYCCRNLWWGIRFKEKGHAAFPARCTLVAASYTRIFAVSGYAMLINREPRGDLWPFQAGVANNVKPHRYSLFTRYHSRTWLRTWASWCKVKTVAEGVAAAGMEVSRGSSRRLPVSPARRELMDFEERQVGLIWYRATAMTGEKLFGYLLSGDEWRYVLWSTMSLCAKSPSDEP